MYPPEQRNNLNVPLPDPTTIAPPQDPAQSALSIMAPLFALGAKFGGSPRAGAALLHGTHSELQRRDQQQQIRQRQQQQDAAIQQQRDAVIAHQQAVLEQKRAEDIQQLITGTAKQLEGNFDKDVYEQTIGVAEQFGQALYQLPPNKIRSLIPYRAPTAKKLLYDAVEKYLKHPANKTAIESGSAANASIQVDTDGDGIPDRPVPLSQAISESGYPVFLDPETQRPILAEKPLKPENVQPFDVAYRGLVANFTTDKGRPPNDAERGKIAVQAQRSLDKPVQAPAGAQGGGNSDVDMIADAIVSGDQPPDLKGLYRLTGPIKAALARRGYNLSDAMLDWQAVTKHLATLNGPQQTKMRQAVDVAYHSLDVIEDLAGQWKAGRFPVLTSARLAAAKGGALGAEANRIAVLLDAQIKDVTSELGNVYMGGNSPTDHALELAAHNLSSNWSEGVLKAAIQQSRKNLQIRQNSMRNVGSTGVSEDNPYEHKPKGLSVVAPNGKTYTFQSQEALDAFKKSAGIQ
jgi:hypothetical protein